jgi:hypothetical protein
MCAYSTPLTEDVFAVKTLIAAALLLALTSPASAGGSAAKWDCGKGIKAIADRGEFSIYMGKPYADDAYPDQGTVKWDLRATNKGTEIWLNGKACKQAN